MCVGLAAKRFLLFFLLLDRAIALYPRNQEINLKLRFVAPGQGRQLHGPSIVTYPNLVTNHQLPSSVNNAVQTININPYHVIRPPQPPVPPLPPDHLRMLQPNAVVSHHQVTYDSPIRGVLRPLRTRLKPPLVIHQPVVNYHYTPAVRFPPTRIVSVPVPVQPATTTSRPIIIVTGFNTSYDASYGYKAGGGGISSTPATLNLTELLNELKAEVGDEHEKGGDKCNCSKTKSDHLHLLNDPFFKGDKEDNYDIGKLDEFDNYDDDVEDDDYDDIDDEPSGKVTAIRNMWGGYLPRSMLENAFKQAASENVKEHEAPPQTAELRRKKTARKVNGKKAKKKKKPRMNPRLLLRLQDGLKALTESIKSHGRDNEVENTIKELHDNDYDNDSDEPDEDASHLTHFVDFWGNKVPKYNNAFDNKEQVIEESAAEYNKDPHGWNPDYAKGLWSDDNSHLKVFSGYQDAASDEKPEYDNGMGEGISKNYNKYVSDNGTWLAGHYNPAGVDMTHIFNESVANELPLDNPSEKFESYEKVVEYLNSKNVPKTESKQPIPKASEVQTTTTPVIDAGATINVKDLLEVLLDKKKEKEGNISKVESDNDAKDANKSETTKEEKKDEPDRKDSENDNSQKQADEDDKQDDDADEELTITDDMTANIGKPPPGALCKKVRDVDLSNDDSSNETHMTHVRGFLCVKDYDNDESSDSIDDDEQEKPDGGTSSEGNKDTDSD